MPHNDLYFRVADATFRVHLTDIDDARPMLPSYAPFHQPDGCGEEELLFTMTVSDGAVPFVGRGTELGRFDCGDIVHNVFRTDDEEDFICNSPYSWNEGDLVSIEVAKEDIKLRLKGSLDAYEVEE